VLCTLVLLPVSDTLVAESEPRERQSYEILASMPLPLGTPEPAATATMSNWLLPACGGAKPSMATA
jgi:hypothetical protein